MCAQNLTLTQHTWTEHLQQQPTPCWSTLNLIDQQQALNRHKYKRHNHGCQANFTADLHYLCELLAVNMGFSLVLEKLFVFLTVSLLCTAVFTAVFNVPIEEINPQKKLDYLVPNQRTPWTTDYFDEQSVYEEVSILQSLNRMIPFFFRRNGFATTGEAAVGQDPSKLDEVVQSLSGNCIIEYLTSFFQDFNYICYSFFSRKSPFERRRRFSTCLARRKYLGHPLQWMSDFSDMLHQSCKEKTEVLDSDPVTAGDEGMFKLESVYSSLVGLYVLFLTTTSIWSLDWTKKSFNKVTIFYMCIFNCQLSATSKHINSSQIVVNMVWFIHFMEKLSKQNCPVIVANGTGFYIKSIVSMPLPSLFKTLYQGARSIELSNHSRIMFMIRNYSFTHFLPRFSVWC